MQRIDGAAGAVVVEQAGDASALVGHQEGSRRRADCGAVILGVMVNDHEPRTWWSTINPLF
jgi:hypothetical protein